MNDSGFARYDSFFSFVSLMLIIVTILSTLVSSQSPDSSTMPVYPQLVDGTGTINITQSDPIGDTSSSTGVMEINTSSIDILNVSATITVAHWNVTSYRIVITCASGGNATIGIKYGHTSVFLRQSGPVTEYNVPLPVTYDRANMSIGVFTVMSVNDTMYYDYAVYLPPQTPTVITRTVFVRHYPSLWNVFGITVVISFAFMALLSSSAVLWLGTIKEKLQAGVLFLMGFSIIFGFAYMQFYSSTDTFLGVFNWSEVPLVQSAVVVVSAVAGGLLAIGAVLSIIILNQKRI